MKTAMRLPSLLVALGLCTSVFAAPNSGNIVGAFEAVLNNRTGSLKLRLECETESSCRLTTVSQTGQSPSVSDVQDLRKVRLLEKPVEAASALRHATEKRNIESRTAEYAELMRRLSPVLSSNPSINQCWDLNYPTPGYSLACTFANAPEESPPLFLFFTLMANCGDVFCRYVIYPMPHAK
jgi:hypothetical protein